MSQDRGDEIPPKAQYFYWALLVLDNEPEAKRFQFSNSTEQREYMDRIEQMARDGDEYAAEIITEFTKIRLTESLT